MSLETNRTIVVTDFACGDDEGAVVYMMGKDPGGRQYLSFISAYGNRSTNVSYNNLRQEIPELNRRLLHPYSTDPDVFYGADRPIGNKRRYRLTPERVEYLIHGDMGNDHKDRPYVREFERSRVLYQRLVKNDETRVSILSLGSTTELPIAIDALAEKLKTIFIMGGVLNLQGNTDPDQEANFRHDPIATLRTFQKAQESGIPIVVLPLDASEQEGVLFSTDRLKYLDYQVGDNYGMHVIYQIAGPESTYGGFYLSRSYHQPAFPYTEINYTGVPLHDMTAAAVQEDFQTGTNVFSYAQVKVKLNHLGQIGIAREYMQPSFPVTIAGPLINYDDYWRLQVEHLKAYR